MISVATNFYSLTLWPARRNGKPRWDYVNTPEVRLLTGRDPSSPKWIRAHADGLVAILLPGLAAGW